MLPWPPRDNPPVFTLNSASASRLVLLRALFHHAYATLPEWVWCLPLPQQSDEVLRAVARVAQSYTRKGIERLAAKYGLEGGEYAIVCALANLGDDIEAFLCEFRADHPDHPFLAAMIDPDERQGRALS
jgi:hypothetical protein